MSGKVLNVAHEKPVSITPSGFFGTGPEMIIEIEDFMSPEELERVSTFARNINQWDVTESHVDEDGVMIYDHNYWEDRVCSISTMMEIDREMPDFIRGLQERLKPYIKQFYDVEGYPTSPCIVRWLPGNYQNPHADKELHDPENYGKPNDFPYYDLGSLFYLNDDYEGGELFFPNQGVEFKPKAGAAYFFPGDLHYIHGVREIKSGIRYTCPMFWTITSHGESHGRRDS